MTVIEKRSALCFHLLSMALALLMVAIAVLGILFGDHLMNRFMMGFLGLLAAYMTSVDYKDICRLVNELDRPSPPSHASPARR